MNNGIRFKLDHLVGTRGLIPVRDSMGNQKEIPFTVISLRPPMELPDNWQMALDHTFFTIRFDKGTEVNHQQVSSYWGFSFSRLPLQS